MYGFNVISTTLPMICFFNFQIYASMNYYTEQISNFLKWRRDVLIFHEYRCIFQLFFRKYQYIICFVRNLSAMNKIFFIPPYNRIRCIFDSIFNMSYDNSMDIEDCVRCRNFKHGYILHFDAYLCHRCLNFYISLAIQQTITNPQYFGFIHEDINT